MTADEHEPLSFSSVPIDFDLNAKDVVPEMREFEVSSAPNQEELREENKLLLLQLRQVQEELIHLRIGQGNISQPIGLFETGTSLGDSEQEGRARERAEKVRDAILASTSWRVLSPFRALWNLGRGKSLRDAPPKQLASVETREARLKAENDVVALLESTSWKLTAPMRLRPFSRAKALTCCRYLRRLRTEIVSRQESTEADLRRAKIEIADLRSRAARVTTLEAETSSALDVALADLGQERRRREELAAVAETQEANLAQLAKELKKSRAELADSQERNDLMQSEIDTLQSDLAQARQTANLATKLQMMREADLDDLRSRYQALRATEERQQALLIELEQRLRSASQYFHEWGLTGSMPSLSGDTGHQPLSAHQGSPSLGDSQKARDP